jgi:hypothetical protein
MAWMGSTLSVLTRQSTRFVTLGDPLLVGSTTYDPIHYLGLIRVEMCFNETFSSSVDGHEAGGCHVITMRSTDVSDTVYEVARLFGSLAMVLGTFLTFFLTASVVWETINIRPIGFSLLLTYFFQSFTMLMFDSRVCATNHCSVGAGCCLSIASAFCWFGSCIATATMEAFKIRATRRRARRRFKRALRDARKKAREKLHPKDRKESIDTFKTSSTSSMEATSVEAPDELGSVVEISSIESSDFENDNRAHGRYEV